MHFFIRFREQGRATAHDFVVAHLAKKQYLCTVFRKAEKSIRRKQITTAPSSLHVRTFVTACLHSSLCHVFAQGHKRRRSARHTLNAGVTKAGQSRANRLPLLYLCYTLTPLCVCLLQDDYIIRSFFHSIGYYPKFFDTKRGVFKIVRGTRREYSLWTPGRDG